MALPKKPIIGITANRIVVESGSFPGAERAGVYQDYITAINNAGGIPIILPIIKDRSEIEQQLQIIDGLLISGGYDVDPRLYGEQPSPLLQDVCRDRDEFEMKAISMASSLGTPIFGICRGLQIINVAFGGTLFQDISLAFSAAQPIAHVQKVKRHETSHSVDLVQGSLLSQIFNVPTIETNSFHHQAIKQLAPGFQVNARSEDGIIEGIERKGSSEVLAVQWHPEMMVLHDDGMLKLFNYFMMMASRFQGSQNGN